MKCFGVLGLMLLGILGFAHASVQTNDNTQLWDEVQNNNNRIKFCELAKEMQVVSQMVQNICKNYNENIKRNFEENRKGENENMLEKLLKRLIMKNEE